MQASEQSGIRRQVRAARRSLSKHQQRKAARSLAGMLVRHPLFLKSRRIAFYLANDGEIDPSLALQRALHAGKQCFLPVLYRGGVNRLLFGRVRAHSRFSVNRYGIPEPDIAVEGWAYAQALDLVLAPLVAFDDSGNRIGMGGGYYDNSLKHLKVDRNWKKPYILGVAHEFQHVEQIGRNAWDVPLCGAVTDQRIYDFAKQGPPS